MKIVYIYRGIPGSGKSTVAKNRMAMSQGSMRLVSADQFFIQEDGSYQFDPREIGNAHAVCFRNFIAAMEDGVTHIHVDNTNIHAYEIAPYILAANAYEYSHAIIPVMCDLQVAFERQTHGAPWSTIQRMHAGLMTEVLPAFWRMDNPVFTDDNDQEEDDN